MLRGMRRKDEPTEWREGRRLRAWQLKEQGWRQKDIAQALGVSEGAVSQWMKRGREGGEASLKRVPPPGATARLAKEQHQQLVQLLEQGAEAHGFVGQVWTQNRVRHIIKRHFGVSYHRDHIGRLLRQIGWSVQKPQQRASQRDEGAIAEWREQKWPQIKKKR
jgi:transposase